MDALTTPSKTLFLSYSRRQTDWCDDLYTAIDTYTHYQRWRDNKIPESADWWDSICVNIEGCYAFVALLTQDYLDSVYCMGELAYALKLRKPVIALMLDDVAYPQPLNEQRLQFARVSGLAMPQVINKVLNAANQITLDYMQGQFSTDIHPRAHLRPQVPTPKPATPTPEEDAVLSEQIEEVARDGQIPTRDLLRRFNEEKGRNVPLARDLLDKIAARDDVPVFFDLDEENAELREQEQRHAEAERQRQRMKRIRSEYDDLAHYVTTAKPATARKAIRRFLKAYPDYGDPQELLQNFLPHATAVQRARSFAGGRNRDWEPYVTWFEDLKIKDMPFCLVPVGAFNMGSDDGHYNDEEPVHQQRIEQPYWIAQYPVTNAQWQMAVRAGAVKEPNDTGSALKWYKDPALADAPVVGVTWFMARDFAVWMGCRLPSEMEWEYAARGVESLRYPWGDEWQPDIPVWKENSGGQPAGVTTRPEGKSWVAAWHMIGNVWEWTSSLYEPYPYRAQDGRERDTANSTDVRRVLRGGSWWSNDTDNLRSACRLVTPPDNHDSTRGFRLARSQE